MHISMRLCSLHADFAVVFTPQAKYTNIRRKHRHKRTPLLTATSRSPPTEGTANLVVSCQEYARTSVRSYHRSTLVRRPVSLAIYARPVRQDKLAAVSFLAVLRQCFRCESVPSIPCEQSRSHLHRGWSQRRSQWMGTRRRLPLYDFGCPGPVAAYRRIQC